MERIHFFEQFVTHKNVNWSSQKVSSPDFHIDPDFHQLH